MLSLNSITTALLPSDKVGTAPEAHTSLSNTPRHKIYVVAVDTDGNRTNTSSPVSFDLMETSPYDLATLSRGGDIFSVVFSPDGAVLASGSGYFTVELWDVATRARIATLSGHTGNVHSVSFSPDGTTLASGSGDNTVKLWDVATRTNTATLSGHTDRVRSVSFSPDGAMVASGSLDGTVKLWDVTTRTNTATLSGHTDWVRSVAFSPDGTTLASGSSDKTVKLWDVANRTNIATLEQASWSSSVDFSSDGTTLASTSGSRVELWDVATKEKIATLYPRTYNKSISSVSFSPDGAVLALGSGYNTVELWDVATKEKIVHFSGHTRGVYSVDFSPDGTMLASSAWDGKVKLWDTSEWAASVTAVSQRTSQVRDAIVAAVPGVNSAEDVTEAHLAAITILDLQRKGITELKAGDFDGLNSLIRLWLRYNELSTLPVGIFDGLTSLTTLYLNSNALTSLPAGIFDGLSELRDLHLSDNALTSLPAGIFDGLSELRLIWLRGNALTLLPVGIFDGLSEPLIEVVLSGNAVNPLPLTVSLDKVGINQFKAVAPSGVPFDLVLPIRVRNGSVSGGTSTLTIPVGSVESEVLTVTRTTGTSGAVSVWIGPLPSLPARHTGYRLVKNTGEFRPLEIFEDISEQVWSANMTVGTWRFTQGNGRSGTGYGYDPTKNVGSISNPTFTYREKTYTIQSISYTRLDNFLAQTFVYIRLNHSLPSCDAQIMQLRNSYSDWIPIHSGTNVISFSNPARIRNSDWRAGERISLTIRSLPTPPDVPGVTVTHEENQVNLSWETLCDGGKDITRHEYRQKTRSGTFGSWIPIPNSGAGGVNFASYTLTNVNNPQDVVYVVRAVNELGEGSVSAPVSPSDRTPQVAEAILNVVKLNYPNVTSFADITDSHLAGITALYLRSRNITTLKSGDFKGLTSLTELRLNGNQLTTLPEGIFDGLTALRNLNLYNNRLSSLPDGLFQGLTALTQLRLGGNSVDPLPLTVSLEKVADGQFKAVAPTGAPFEIVLPLIVTNGSINAGATTITIPAGSVESAPLTITRTPGTTFAVNVDIGTLPALPPNHSGYALVKSNDLPLAASEGDIPDTVFLTMTVGGGPSAALRGYNPHSQPEWNFGSLSSQAFAMDGVSYTLHKLVYSVAGKTPSISNESDAARI